MGEFKMSPRAFPTRRHDNIMVGLVTIGAILLVVGILIFIGYGPHSVVERIFPILRWGIVLLILCAVATDFMAMRRTSQRVRHELTFVLNEDELIRKRPGHPDARLSLSQIKSLYEQSGFLVVAGGDPPLRIAVPKKVENFELLQAELLRYASLAPPPAPRRITLGWITALLAIVCWWLLLFSSNITTTWVAGGVAVLLMGEWSFEIRHRLLHGPNRIMFWTMFGLAWLTAGLLIYIRLFGGRV